MNRFGLRLQLSLFGESHGPAVGGILDGVPPGIAIDLTAVAERMAARRPGSALTSLRQEVDEVEILSGILRGKTTGAPLAFLIRNQDVRSQDYEAFKSKPRPGHGDYPALVRSGGHADLRGGGHHSGRLTAPIVAAAALMSNLRNQFGLRVESQLVQAGNAEGDHIPVAIAAARGAGDSLGGRVSFIATGLPAGVGEPFFHGAKAHLAHILFSLPGVHAVEFGSGVAAGSMRGSNHNDAWVLAAEGGIKPATNRAGGVLGGYSTGAPLQGHVTWKPTSSIAMAQATVDLQTGEATTIAVEGRHDPCIAVRGVPVVQAAVELAILDLLLCKTGIGDGGVAGL